MGVSDNKFILHYSRRAGAPYRIGTTDYSIINCGKNNFHFEVHLAIFYIVMLCISIWLCSHTHTDAVCAIDWFYWFHLFIVTLNFVSRYVYMVDKVCRLQAIIKRAEHLECDQGRGGWFCLNQTQLRCRRKRIMTMIMV